MPVNAVYVPEPMNPYAMPSLEEIESRKAKIDAVEENPQQLTDAQIAARNAIALAQGKSGTGINVEDFNAIRDEYKSKTAAAESAEAEEEDDDSEEVEEPDTDMIELANNKVFSVETIAKQANRVKGSQQNNGEVYISLH